MAHKFISLFLSLLFVSSPLSYSFNFHYCSGRLVVIDSIFENHKGCGMESKSDLTTSCKEQLHSDCCSDVFLGTIKYSDHVSKTVQSIKHNQPSSEVYCFMEELLYYYEDSNYLTTLARPPDDIQKLYLTYHRWTFYG